MCTMIKIISDTSPIIGLAKINSLSLLKTFSSQVLIPPMVHRELLSKIGSEWNQIEDALNELIKITDLPPKNNAAKIDLMDIDEGERQAIELAYSINNELLLIDDKAGRKAAKKLEVNFTGLIGLIIEAKEKRIINNVGKLIEDLRNNGYWLSDHVVEIAKRCAGED